MRGPSTNTPMNVSLNVNLNLTETLASTMNTASLVSLTVFRQRVVILAVLSFLAMC